MNRAQLVRPAGAGHETLYVLLTALLILSLAAGVIALRGEREDEVSLASHQIDARRDLSPAEQGIYTDLHVAFDEIQLLREENAAIPEVEALAEEGLPPFVVDASSQSRGRHQWQRLNADSYLGRSQDLAVAGSFLMLLPSARDEAVDVWLLREADAQVPADLSVQALTRAGWRQIVSHFDAGVTRQHRH